MKVAVFSEDYRDELAVRILVDSVIGKTTSPVNIPLGARGWDGLKNNLPIVIKALHYNNPDAEGLIVVADSDNTPLHTREHELADQFDSRCRFCILQLIVRQTVATLSPVTNRLPLKIAIGIAIPAMEAWMLCGKDSRGAEAAWHQSNAASQGASYRKVLKVALYGAEIVPQQKRNQITRDEASRLAQDINLLETHFPIGFGLLANAIRTW